MKRTHRHAPIAPPTRSRFIEGALALALVLVGCDDKPAPTAIPETAKATETASAAATSPTLARSAAPTASAADTPIPAETVAAAPSAVASSAASGSASAAPSAASTARAATGKGVTLPDPANGVLAPGAADKILKAGSKATLRVVDAGAEPRSALAYAFKKGPTRPLAVGLDMVMGMSAPGKTLPPTAVPRVTMTLDLNPAEKGADDAWRVDAKLRGVTVDSKPGKDAEIADAMRKQFAGMSGIGMSYWVTPHGEVRDVKVDLPGSAPQQAQQVMQSMNQSFESMVAPLPSEPVGTGAKWQVVTRLSASGMDLVQAATFTLKSRTDSKIDVEVSLKQLAANDEIKVPGMGGASAKIKKFKSGGGGQNRIDTHDVAPDSGDLTVKSTMEIEAGAGQSMTIDSNMTLHFSRPAS